MVDKTPRMRKLNSAIDIIPIQSVSGEDTRAIVKSRGEERHNSALRDPMLIQRVQTYLYENEDKIYIDVNEMADDLQRKYRDYRTKKRGPFRVTVRRAYDEITERFSKKSDSMSKQDDYDDEIEVESDGEGDALSNEILKMYKKKSFDEQNGNSSDKELIDISSDDDKPDEAVKKIMELAKINKGSPHACTIAKTSKELTLKPEENRKKLIEYPPSKFPTIPEKAKKRPRERSIDHSPMAVLKRKKEAQPKQQVPAEKRIKFSDVGGNAKILETVCRLVMHMKHPEIFKQLGMSPTRGFLLHGPPGCGKSLLADAIAGELEVPLIKIAAPELIGGVSGESELRIRNVFEQAVALAPCVLFLDEIDTLAPNRSTAQKEMERRIVAQLLSSLDSLGTVEHGDKVLVLGATNRPDAIDPALRRAGRFDREICLGIPDKEARRKILEIHSSTLKLSPDVDLLKIAALSPGFVGADLVALLREAAIAAVDRVFKKLQLKNTQPSEPEKIVEKEPEKIVEENNEEKPDEAPEKASASDEANKPEENSVENSVEEKEDSPIIEEDTSKTNGVAEKIDEEVVNEKVDELAELLKMLHDKVPLSPSDLADLKIENDDFDVAFRVVQPSSKREGFATVPDVTWDDIGALSEIREELQMAILAPVKHSKEFETFGLITPTGVLLCGPPGCGKTQLAKAIANEAEINFISVKGPELLNMYVGESEKAVRQCFIRARNSAPCVIFFDELDALCPKRSEGDNSATSRVVNQVLTEMDGIEGRKGVYLMAATNRPDIIDPAVMRPGRFDKILYVGLPVDVDRVDIIRALTKNGTKPKFAEDVDIEVIGKSERCEGYTGADLASLVRESAIEALRESMANSSGLTQVHMRHVEAAFNKVRPSVQEKEAKHYEKLKKQYTVQKQSPEDIPMETPVDTPMQDAPLEAMET